MRFANKALIIGLIICLFGEFAMAYEEPGYQVVKTYAAFELRQYEPYLIAETHVKGDFSEVGNRAFRRLFGYISEEARPQGKIAMTTPVIQQPVPAATQAADAEAAQAPEKTYRFAFVMPAAYSLEDLPVPENADVKLKAVPARLMAARRYSGTWSEQRYRENEKILLEALAKQGLQTIGPPVFARYNAPFSLWFLRRNEVLIEVKPFD